jgi:hypothetical protein
VEPLPERVFHALADALSKAEEHAGIPPGTDADGVAKAIDVTISRSHRNRQPLPDDVTAALGELWGKAVAQTTGWTWAHVVRGEAKYVCLVSKDRAYACAPLNFIKAQVDPKRETTALLFFNMIKAGKLPDSKAGQLLDVLACPRCGGRMRLVALVTEAPSVRRFLRGLGESTDAPARAPARGPPYWRSRVLRRAAGEVSVA